MVSNLRLSFLYLANTFRSIVCIGAGIASRLQVKYGICPRWIKPVTQESIGQARNSIINGAVNTATSGIVHFREHGLVRIQEREIRANPMSELSKAILRQ
jgi:hypothetical protein